MRLGGFVIHGDEIGQIGRSLESVAAVCDDLVAVDTGTTGAASDLAAAHGFRVVRRPWEGYGAARAQAVAALSRCNWIFFLDSDEWLEAPAREAILRFKAGPHDTPYAELTRRDWCELSEGRFLYRMEHHVRLVRRDHARWNRSMIVHEALPPARKVRLDASLEHLFATDLEAMQRKLKDYAMLWALRARREGRRPKSPTLQRAAHLFREMILKRALFRNRREALSLATIIAEYHALKYLRLRELESGDHAPLAALFEADHLGELFRALRRQDAHTEHRMPEFPARAPRPLPPIVDAMSIAGDP